MFFKHLLNFIYLILIIQSLTVFSWTGTAPCGNCGTTCSGPVIHTTRYCTGSSTYSAHEVCEGLSQICTGITWKSDGPGTLCYTLTYHGKPRGFYNTSSVWNGQCELRDNVPFCQSSNNAGCSGSTPICKNNTSCVKCLATGYPNQGCNSSTPYCLNESSCVQCSNNSHCGPKQVCLNGACTGYCGDGRIGNNENCEPPNQNYCNSQCLKQGQCGDGVVQSFSNEQCDDGNSSNDDECRNDCTINPFCQSDADCDDPALPFCVFDQDHRGCQECKEDSDCVALSESKPYCYPDFTCQNTVPEIDGPSNFTIDLNHNLVQGGQITVRDEDLQDTVYLTVIDATDTTNNSGMTTDELKSLIEPSIVSELVSANEKESTYNWIIDKSNPLLEKIQTKSDVRILYTIQVVDKNNGKAEFDFEVLIKPKQTLCGDGIVQTWNAEQCDDSDTMSGDGCSSGCKIENGCTCPKDILGNPMAGDCSCLECTVDNDCATSSKPICVNNTCVECEVNSDCGTSQYCSNNACIGFCGDGVIGNNEQCDDLDIPPASGDGCSSTCQKELNCTCPVGSNGNPIGGDCTCEDTTPLPPPTDSECVACTSETDLFTGQIQDPKPPTDVFFTIDVSSSVSNANYDQFSLAVEELFNLFNIGSGPNDDRYAVIQFSNTTLLYDLDTEWHETLNNGPFMKLTNGSSDGNVSTMETSTAAYASSREIAGGATALAGALKVYDKYIDHAGRKDSIKLMIIIHDMGDADVLNEITKAIAETNRIKQDGKYIVSIRTMDSSASTDAFATPGVAFSVDNIDNLVQTIQTTVIDEVLSEVYIQDEFFLTKSVDSQGISEIKVFIEGVLVDNSKWQYNSVTNSIKFTKKEFAPREGQGLKVSYCSSCGECKSDLDCNTDINKPLCSSTSLCVPCNDSSISNSQTRCANKISGTICAVNSGSEQGQCVIGNCTSDNDCPFNDPRCLNYTCTDCTSDSQCVRFPNTPNCNLATGSCVNCVDNNDCDAVQVCVNGSCSAGNCLVDTDCPRIDPVCGSNNYCTDCTNDSQCTRFPDTPNCNITSGECVDCVDNNDCSSGEVCLNGNCIAGNCLVDSDCPATDPVCGSNNYCTDCTNDSQCLRFPDTLNCNTATGQCVNCVDNNDCAAGEVCINGVCTAGNCLNDKDCPRTDPVCLNNFCTDCTSDSQCLRFPDTPNCNFATGVCVDCVDNNDCLLGEVCLNGTCIPGNCLVDADCPASDPVCGSNNYCTDCTNDSQCLRFPNLPNCNINTGECVNCVDNSDCPEDYVCENGVCVEDRCQSDDECEEGQVCFHGRCVDLDGGGNYSGIDCDSQTKVVYPEGLPELISDCNLSGLTTDELNYSYKLYCTKNHKTACIFCKKHLLQDRNCQKACAEGNVDVCTRCEKSKDTQGVCDLAECLYEEEGCNSASLRKWSQQFTFPRCANGILEYPEECDDGNSDNGDGCSDICEVE